MDLIVHQSYKPHNIVGHVVIDLGTKNDLITRSTRQ